MIQVSKIENSTLWQEATLNGKGFTAITGFISLANTSETDFFLLKNPAAGKLIRFKELQLTIGASATQKSIFRVYRTPTITANGTLLTTNKILSNHPNTSITEVYQSPTISARGTLINIFELDFNTYVREQDLARYLVAGSNLLITCQSGTNGIEHNLTLSWMEQ